MRIELCVGRQSPNSARFCKKLEPRFVVLVVLNMSHNKAAISYLACAKAISEDDSQRHIRAKAKSTSESNAVHVLESPGQVIAGKFSKRIRCLA